MGVGNFDVHVFELQLMGISTPSVLLGTQDQQSSRLLFGGCEKSDRHYFTPVDALFEDIKAKTGAVAVRLLGA